MSRTILVVDDHVGFRAMARRTLESNLFVVVGEAATGEDAVRELDRLAPDVVLLDIQLPDTDGFLVAERMVRGRPSPPRILLTSSRPLAEIRRRLASSSAEAFLPKDRLTPVAVHEALPP